MGLIFAGKVISIYMEVPVIPKQLRTEYAELDKRGRLGGFFYLKLQMSNFLLSYLFSFENIDDAAKNNDVFNIGIFGVINRII